MAGWHHQLDGSESEQTLGDAEGQGGLACRSPWGHKEPGMTERLNQTELILAWRNPMGRGAWQATVLGVTKDQTRLSY